MTLYTASISKRVLAFVIDFILVSIMGLLLFGVASEVGTSFRSDWLLITLYLITGLGVVFYLPICETFFNGKSIAKRMLGIQVVRTDGSPVSGVESMQRFLMLFFDLVTTLGIGGLISMIVTDKSQRLGDLLAGTLVVNTSPHTALFTNLFTINRNILTEKETKVLSNINPYVRIDNNISPRALADSYRRIECDMAMLNTSKGDGRLIEYLDTMLSSLHLTIFRRKGYTWGEMITFGMRSIPEAVYDSRWAILASLMIALIGMIIGYVTQCIHSEFFEQLYGSAYTEITNTNIAENNPMGIYKSESPLSMFFQLFVNNFRVLLNLYVLGLLTFIGPLYMLLTNFISFGTFDAYFMQHGLIADALIVPNEHGILELSSIILVGGASIRLGTGWLFPGELTRLAAFNRTGRQSLLIMLSTIPMLLIAALIESFVTRHYEWPIALKLTVIIVSSLIITGYYVMLPILARRRRNAS